MNPLNTLLAEFQTLEAHLSDPDVIADQSLYTTLSRKYSSLQAVARGLPSSSLAEVLRGALSTTEQASGTAWAVLIGWAVLGPVIAIRLFRWE